MTTFSIYFDDSTAASSTEVIGPGGNSAAGLVNTQRPLRAVGLGDSIMLGSDSTQVSNTNGLSTWLTMLQGLCGGKLVIAKNAGIPGNTSKGMHQRIFGDVLAYDPDVVFINSGSNDMSAGTGALVAVLGSVDTVTWVMDMARIVASHGAFPVVLSQLPKENVTISTAIVAKNATLAAACTAAGIKYIDINAAVRQSDGSWVPAYTSDNIHPTKAGNKVIARTVHAAIQSLLPTWERPPSAMDYINGAASDRWNGIANGTFLPITPGDTTATLGGGWSVYGGVARTYSRVNDGLVRGNWQRVAWGAGGTTGDTILFSSGINTLHRFRGKRVSISAKVRLQTGNEAADNACNFYALFLDAAGTAITTCRCYAGLDGINFLQTEDTVPAHAVTLELRLTYTATSTTAANSIDVAEVSLTEVRGVRPFPGATELQPNPIQTKTANATLTLADAGTILVDATAGAVTLILPEAQTAVWGFNTAYGGFGSATGLPYEVIKIDASANAVTIQRAGSDTISGATSISLAAQWDKALVRAVSNSTFVQLI